MYLTKDDIVEVLHQMKDFENELNNLKSFVNDELLEINDNNIVLTSLGEHFSPQVANVFDTYDNQKFYE